MTREEAIQRLKANRGAMYFPETIEALDMAIEALSADAKGDLINRQWLLDLYSTPIDGDDVEWKVPLEVVRQNILDAPSAEAVQGWIPVTEMLPEAEDMYQPPEQRYLCQLEAYGERKFCVLSRLKGAVSPFWDWYGVAVHDYEVKAWMPLPEPYREDGKA